MAAAAAVLLAGCCWLAGGGEDPPPPPPPPDKAAADNPFAALAEAARQQAAKRQAPAPRPGQPAQPASPQEVGKAMGDMAQGFAQAMQAMGQAGQGPDGKPVKVVEFGQLLPLLPNVPPGWEADDAKGETTEVGAIKATTVRRRYRNKGQSVRVKIVDTSFNPVARQGFRFAQLVRETSTEGFKRGTTLGGQPAIEEWNKGSERAKVVALVADRFIVEVDARPVPDTTLCASFFQAINLPGLVALTQ